MAKFAQFLAGLVSLITLAIDTWRAKNVQEKYDAVKKDGPTPWFKGHFNTPANTASTTDADSVRSDDNGTSNAADTNA